MRKMIDFIDFQVNFEYLRNAMEECFCAYTPKYRRLKREILNVISDINVIKDFSYSFKKEIQSFIAEYNIT